MLEIEPTEQSGLREQTRRIRASLCAVALGLIAAVAMINATCRRNDGRTQPDRSRHRGRGGITALAKRARDELTATGARPRRAMLSDVEALTPSEPRVADFAARALTTRQIAEPLFVTPKAIEYHIRRIYQKLDISTRSDLREMLGGGSDDS